MTLDEEGGKYKWTGCDENKGEPIKSKNVKARIQIKTFDYYVLLRPRMIFIPMSYD